MEDEGSNKKTSMKTMEANIDGEGPKRENISESVCFNTELSMSYYTLNILYRFCTFTISKKDTHLKINVYI